MLKPLFVYMVDPTKIPFDDDIVMCVKAVIRKTKAVSQTQWDILSQLPKVLAKNKDSLGNLLDVTNHYLQYGTKELASTHSQMMTVVAQMAETALFT